MSDSIKTKFLQGIGWTFIQNIAVRILSLVFSIILARHLMPSDYGLIGMLSIFIAISEAFVQSGFGLALIQKVDCSEDDYSTSFVFNIVISVLIFLILFLIAPLISWFYHEPQLVLVTRVLSINFVLGALNIVQQARLRKELNFRPLAIVALVSTLVSGVLGILMAYAGFGVWALVAQTLCTTLLSAILFPFYTRWFPKVSFKVNSFKYLWGFGSKLLFTAIFDVINLNLSNILIGKFYQKDLVGFFSKAKNLADVPTITMSTILGSVMFPMLSELQTDEERHKNIFMKVSRNTAIITFPVIILLTLLANPIILLLLTEKWAYCIPLFQALLLSRIFLSLNVLNANFLQSLGETKLYMFLYFITGPLSLLTIILAIPLGVKAMAWASFIGGLIYYLIFTSVIGKKIGYNIFRQIWDQRMMFVSLFMMSSVVVAVTIYISNLCIQLLLGGLFGSLMYLFCCKIFNLIDDDIQIMIKKKFVKNR